MKISLSQLYVKNDDRKKYYPNVDPFYLAYFTGLKINELQIGLKKGFLRRKWQLLLIKQIVRVIGLQFTAVQAA
ncbi:hypothetical protein EV46_18260 [Pectobacterium atrosepticum]|nr:hypothetical protein EV46_18260 [Pectobacterium atrosepticum]